MESSTHGHWRPPKNRGRLLALFHAVRAVARVRGALLGHTLEDEGATCGEGMAITYVNGYMISLV